MRDGSSAAGPPRTLQRSLGLWSSVAVVIGSTIGSGIFRSPAGIADKLPGPLPMLAVWTAGGVFALCGALTLAEVASALPRTGGMYVFCRDGWGRLAGFLFGWGQFSMIRAASLGAISITFAEYLFRVLGIDPQLPANVQTVRIAAAAAQITKYYDQLSEGGIRRLLDRGAWYSNNHYSHATTYTGVGHATLLSCAHPYKHGVIGNDWLDKKTKQRIYSTEDARHTYLDEDTPKHSGTSPFNMKVTTVGDELIDANRKSRVVAISGKDRSAIGLAGQTGTAYMYSPATGRFVTSTYYMKDYPEWWKNFYAGKPQDKFLCKAPPRFA